MKRKEIIRAILWGVSTVFILSVLTFITESFPLKHQVQKYDSLYEMAAVVTVPQPFIVTHINTPEEVKALYMTSWVAGNVKLRKDLIDTTELNALVIDVKDYTGKISFSVSNTPALNSFGSAENRIPEIERFIGMLHDKGIYVIGRISVFQDSYLVKTHPEYAVKTKSGAVWKDRKGVSWLDAGAKPVWDYIIKIADKAYDVGFDEINFDYIRFPSDGNMNDIYYPYSNGKNKSRVLKDFFAYIDKYFHEKNIPISADLFGMTTSNTDDLGIGQILEDALL